MTLDVLLLFSLLSLFLFLRVLNVATRPSRKVEKKSGANLLIIVGSGGHTAEMLTVLRSFSTNFSNLFPLREYVFATSDITSTPKIDRFEREKEGLSRYHFVPRAREVGQSYFTSIFTTLNAFWASVRVYVKTKPDAILANGPGTCIPVITACFVGKIVGFNRRCKVMYVESVSRTKRMSLSGRLCYSLRLADVVFVMWPELKETYPRAKFCGRIY